MTTQELQKHISDYQAIYKKRIRQQLYYIGQHPGIFYEGQKEAPDNRVPVPIPRKAVGFVSGYMAKPGNIRYQGEFYEQTLKPIYNTCEEQLLNAELLTSCLKHGCAYTVHWNDGSNQYFAECPTEQSYMIYNDKLGIFAEPEYFLRIWRDGEHNYVDVWDSLNYIKYEYAGKAFMTLETKPHGYRQVPVVEYKINPDKANLYDHVCALIDILDKGVSEDLANELQRLASSYLLLANDIDGSTTDENGETEVDKIKRTKIFANLREDVSRQVAFLTKNLDPSFINSALDRLERLVYELIGIPNPSDDTFAASSGIALAYKLVPLEYLATTIEAYFTRGLQKRIRLISDGDYTINGNKEAQEVQISWTRNLPFDLESISRVAMALKGILSDETILKLFPTQIVSDVEEELEKIAKQSDTLDIGSVEPAEEEVNGEQGLS